MCKSKFFFTFANDKENILITMPKNIGKQEIKSPYSAAFTAASMMHREMTAIIPLMMDENAEVLLKQEIEENKLLCINSLSSRKRVVSEFQRRFNAVPRGFWEHYMTMGEQAQRVALLYVMLKTYQLLFDIHICVTLNLWRSASGELQGSDVMLYLNELASQDSFVDSWSESTRKKVVTVYVLTLHQAGLMKDGSAALCQPDLRDDEWIYYIRMGEAWFLEACFLPTYRVNELKQKAK